MAGLMGFHRRRIEKSAFAQEVVRGGGHIEQPRDREEELLEISSGRGIQCSFLGGDISAPSCSYEDVCEGDCLLFRGAPTA